ncbi:MAG: hypothetical protein HY902_18415 [Deltaproteobacteria bacterium]|nr:hypothetical protein [Deltaproteobacteria bacterium]
MSNCSHPSPRRTAPRQAAILGLLLALAPACGKNAAEPSSATVKADAASGPDSVDALAGTADATASGQSCQVDADCPASPSVCSQNVCSSNHTCVTKEVNGLPCSDGDPCTLSSYCAAGACVADGPPACQCQTDQDCGDDGNACNGKNVCDKTVFPYVCKVAPSTVPVCPSSTDSCSVPTCDPSTGACKPVAAADGTPCKPQNPCASAGACKAGACQAVGPSWCQCEKTADCAPYEDGNLCNGQLYCDTTKLPHTCKLNPGSVVSCGSDSDPPCQRTACQPKTGTCALVPVEDAKQVCDAGTNGCTWVAKAAGEASGPTAACDDGNVCTVGELCSAGKCQGGANTCSCKSNADCLAQDDGNLCNGVAFCNQALSPPKCQPNPASVVFCPIVDDTDCRKNTCSPKTGLCACPPGAKFCDLTPTEYAVEVCDGGICRWESLPPGTTTQAAACDDGNACTAGEVCSLGQCGGGVDTCICQSDADCAGQEDGNACNGTMFCNQATKKCQVNPGTVVVCPTGLDTDCKKNVCEPTTGACVLANSPTTVVCEDGDPCTTSDTCLDGKCTPGTNVCSCKSDADCKKYEDGDQCNGTMYCNKLKSPAICELNPATVISCPSVDDSECLKNLCQPKTGQCQFTPTDDFATCSDGNACTKNDLCLQGKCVPGTFTCECASNADCLKQDDGDLCNGVLYCDKTGAAPKCLPNPASVVYCSPGQDSACLKNTCDAKTGVCGLTPQPKGTPCDDGSVCTASDACLAGKCAGQLLNCNDEDPCTVDSCGDQGCTHSATACADGNDCTADQCDAKTGQCSFVAKDLDGKACNADEDGCTAGDACLAGQCKAGVPIVCKNSVAACEKATCVSTGAKSFQCVAVAQPDGAVCTGNDGCAVDGICKSGQCAAGKTGKLFIQTVQEVGAGISLRAVAAVGTDLVVAGRQIQPDLSAVWFVQRYAPGLKPVWSKPLLLPVSAASSTAEVVGAAVVDNLALVAGRVGSANAGDQVRLVAIDLVSGAVSWDHLYGQTSLDEIPARLVSFAAGSAVLGRTQAAAGTQQAMVMRLSATGLQLWTWLGGAGTQNDLRAGLAQPDGGVLAAGRSLVSGQGKAWLQRLDAQGVPLWSAQLGEASDQGFVALAPLPGGSLVAGGWATVAGQPRLYLQAVTSAGAPTGPAYLSPGAYLLSDLLVSPIGSLWLAGRSYADPGGNAWLAGADPSGHMSWSLEHDVGLSEGFDALAATTDGGLVAVGSQLDPKKPQTVTGLVARTDAWGHANCALAGVCAAKTIADCANSNPCTDDLCDGLQGCVALHNALPCSDGDACTGGDSCVQAACVPGKAVNCDDGNACTADACDKQKGCTHQGTNGAPCPDDSVCTSNETCLGPVCKTSQLDCADNDPCTQDSCEKSAGCLHDPVPDETLCGGAKVCAQGKCVERFAKAISTGGEANTYALRYDGTVWGWGYVHPTNGNTAVAPPMAVGSLANIVQIDAAPTGVCGVQADGLVRCYRGGGDGNFGQLTCQGVSNPTAQLIPNLTDVVKIDIGRLTGTAVTKDGSLWTWGTNSSGQLGLGTCGACNPAVKQHPTLTGIAQATVGVSETGTQNALFAMGDFLKIDGTLWGAGGYFGNNSYCDSYGGSYSYIGDANGTIRSAVPLQVAIPTKVVSVAVGIHHRCALDDQGQVWCWGLGTSGELGDGGKATQPKPVKVFGQPGKAAGVTAGLYFTCAWGVDGAAWCWGSNTYHTLGVPSVYGSNTPLVIPDLTGVKQMTASPTHACALRVDGSVWCWGYNSTGNGLGTGVIGGYTTSPKPVIGTVPP